MDDEFVLGTAVVRAFVDDVRTTITATFSPEQACEALRPQFAELLGDPHWLPAEYQAAAPKSGMGGGIGQWLLYRAKDQSLSLFSLVVPSGSATPIHDHLAWGLVGLYRGEQDEEIYARRDGALELVERRSLAPGDFYVLIPPRDDIHRVRTTSADTSVSIHLLTNDTGCVWRHSFDPASGEASPFRSGYVNVACEDEAHPVPAAADEVGEQDDVEGAPVDAADEQGDARVGVEAHCGDRDDGEGHHDDRLGKRVAPVPARVVALECHPVHRLPVRTADEPLHNGFHEDRR